MSSAIFKSLPLTGAISTAAPLPNELKATEDLVKWLQCDAESEEEKEHRYINHPI